MALYQTTARSVNGRNGVVTVENSKLTFELASPIAMGGNTDDAVNPEQLFAAGYAACFGGALHHVIRARKLRIPLPEAKLTVGLDIVNGGHVLSADITGLFKELDQATADDIMREAHTVCPYSKATMGNIPVTLKAEIL
ncbi:MAG TPA: Ohr family peroxiredoxin [Feifaniaceae bacterium]|nr:Ohr family peroxiredoxin [Feifaniaceae bacterium]